MLSWLTTVVLTATALCALPAKAQPTNAQLIRVLQTLAAESQWTPSDCVSSTLLKPQAMARSGLKTAVEELVAKHQVDPAILQQQWTQAHTRQAVKVAVDGLRPRTLQLVRDQPDDGRCKAVLAIEPPYGVGDMILVRALSSGHIWSLTGVYLFDLAAGQVRLIAKSDGEIVVS